MFFCIKNMSLNGWYKSDSGVTYSLYQFSIDALLINIQKTIQGGIYSGSHIVNGKWVSYTSQSEMNTIWDAYYSGATPLPGKL